MNRRKALLGMACLAAGSVSAQGTVEWVLAHQFDAGSLSGRTAGRFAREIEALSAGRARIRVVPGGALGDEVDNLSLLRQGRLPLSLTGDLPLGTLEQAYRVLKIPFLYRDTQHALATYSSELGQRMLASLRGSGVEPLSWQYIGTRQLTANRPIAGLKDLAGLVLRLPADPTWQMSWRALSVDTVTVSFPELLPALKAGRIDAQENPPTFIRAGGFHAYQRYLIKTAHIPQRQFLLASSVWWASLSALQRDWVAQAAQRAAQWTTETAQRDDASDMVWLGTQGGMQILPFDRDGVAARLKGIPQALSGAAGMRLAAQIDELGR